MTTDTKDTIEMELRELSPLDDLDVFDSARWLLDNNIDPDDRAKCKEAIGPDDSYTPEAYERFVDWVIATVKANAGGVQKDGLGCTGFVPRMPTTSAEMPHRRS